MIFMPFDTETTGLPNWKIPSDDPGQPHIVSVAALLVNEATYEIEDSLDLIVKPDGWEWDEDCEAFKQHGITMEVALAVGIPEEEVIDRLIEFWRKAKYRVAHNTTFDNRIVRIALKRYRQKLLDEWKEGEYRCTLSLSRPILNLPKKKKPSLKEAYEFFTGKEIENEHEAMGDTLSCLEVYKGVLKHNNEKGPAQSMGLDSIFKFGKHKDQQLEDVITDHPDYIEWLIKGDVVIFDNEALELISKKKIA